MPAIAETTCYNLSKFRGKEELAPFQGTRGQTGETDTLQNGVEGAGDKEGGIQHYLLQMDHGSQNTEWSKGRQDAKVMHIQQLAHPYN